MTRLLVHCVRGPVAVLWLWPPCPGDVPAGKQRDTKTVQEAAQAGLCGQQVVQHIGCGQVHGHAMYMKLKNGVTDTQVAQQGKDRMQQLTIL